MKQLRSALLNWYRRNQRDLPWRHSQDPYAIWISEAMLQQTRVDTVIPYYHRFLKKFPNVKSLAKAELDDVLQVWSGLGYYSRARNLKSAAEKIIADFNGALPDSLEELQTLPGVGRYTAGAVASIAFDQPAPIVDGNVMRVLARVYNREEDLKKPAMINWMWEQATTLVQGRHPGDVNQAIMELGALVCTPRTPDCTHCPLKKICQAYAEGNVDSIPAKRTKAQSPRVNLAMALVLRKGKALLVRRPPYGLFGGLWELPGGELAGQETPLRGVRRTLRAGVGLAVTSLHKTGSLEHVLTHRHFRVHVFYGEAQAGRVQREGFDAHRWLSPGALTSLPQSTLTQKVLELVLSSDSR